jgi:hypothetical protein
VGASPRSATLPVVDRLDDHPGGLDDGRTVDFAVEDAPLLPDQTGDDTGPEWGDRSWSNDERLLDDRPPHWD